MGKYRVGSYINVKVNRITKSVIYVTSNGDNCYWGTIHISEISDYYVKDIHNYVSVNDIIKAKILRFNEDKCKFDLSIKGIDYKSLLAENKNAIKETKHGFSSLAYHLPIWMSKNLEKIKNN